MSASSGTASDTIRWTAASQAIATWGVVSVLLVLGQALWRLTPLAIAPIRDGALTPFQAALYAAWVLISAYSEGYRGFHKGFSPRVVGRATHLGQHPRLWHVLLAPAFCMSLFHASRRGLVVAWSVVLVITGLVIAVHQLAQPWRGIVDGGVVVGLAMGSASIVYHFALALTGRAPVARLNLPGTSAASQRPAATSN